MGERLAHDLAVWGRCPQAVLGGFTSLKTAGGFGKPQALQPCECGLLGVVLYSLNSSRLRRCGPTINHGCVAADPVVNELEIGICVKQGIFKSLYHFNGLQKHEFVATSFDTVCSFMFKCL